MSKKLADRLKDLIVELASNPGELYDYVDDPPAYLRARGFPEDAIEAMMSRNEALQSLLAREGSGSLSVTQTQGVRHFRPRYARRAAAGMELAETKSDREGAKRSATKKKKK